MSKKSEQTRALLLGIDPSFVTMGAAIYDPKTKSLDLKTGEFNQVAQWIKPHIKNVIAIVENPAKDSPTFKMWGLIEKEVKMLLIGKGSWVNVRSCFSVAMNYSQKVGENKAAAKQIIKALHANNVPVLEVSPSERKKAYKMKGSTKHRLKVQFLKWPTKTNRDQFYELTGYSQQCSEHARDAATLVYRMSIVGTTHLINIQKELNTKSKKPDSLPGTHNHNYSLFNNQSS